MQSEKSICTHKTYSIDSVWMNLSCVYTDDMMWMSKSLSPPHCACCVVVSVCPVLLSFLPLCLLSQRASSGSHQWPSQPMSLFPPNTAMCYSDGNKIIGPFVCSTCAATGRSTSCDVLMWWECHRSLEKIFSCLMVSITTSSVSSRTLHTSVKYIYDPTTRKCY